MGAVVVGAVVGVRGWGPGEGGGVVVVVVVRGGGKCVMGMVSVCVCVRWVGVGGGLWVRGGRGE